MKGFFLSVFLFKYFIWLSRLSSQKVTNSSIGLITVSDTILTGRQSGQKLQCLYGNPMAKNFFQNRILRNL